MSADVMAGVGAVRAVVGLVSAGELDGFASGARVGEGGDVWQKRPDGLFVGVAGRVLGRVGCAEYVAACGALGPGPDVRGIVVARAEVSGGRWSLTVREVHPSGSRDLVSVSEVDALVVNSSEPTTDLDYGLVDLGFHRVTGWLPRDGHTSFTCYVRPLPVVPAPAWATTRTDVRGAQIRNSGELEVSFEKVIGDLDTGPRSSVSVYVSQSFVIEDGRPVPEPARAYVSAEYAALDPDGARLVAEWLTQAAELAASINADTPVPVAVAGVGS